MKAWGRSTENGMLFGLGCVLSHCFDEVNIYQKAGSSDPSKWIWNEMNWAGRGWCIQTIGYVTMPMGGYGTTSLAYGACQNWQQTVRHVKYLMKMQLLVNSRLQKTSQHKTIYFSGVLPWTVWKRQKHCLVQMGWCAIIHRNKVIFKSQYQRIFNAAPKWMMLWPLTYANKKLWIKMEK